MAVKSIKGIPSTCMNSLPTAAIACLPAIACMLAGVVSFVVQMLLFGIVLFPLAVLYLLGVYLSAGISLWRLIQHDYGYPEGGANLMPALNVLYSLAVAEGVVYGYRAIHHFLARTELVERVAKYYLLERNLVWGYLEKTEEGCMKDPSFARGRNLVTYAVDLLMESKSRYGYISGVMILGKVISQSRIEKSYRQSSTMKELLARSASFSHVVHRLVETFGPTSPYSTEIRVRAARIVATIAGSIRLDHFPGQGTMMIQCISSLLDTFEEYSWRPEGYGNLYERDWLLEEDDKMYSRYVNIVPTRAAADEFINASIQNYGSLLQGNEGLVMQGLHILVKLAANEDNCRVIAANTQQGLLSKMMVYLISDNLHEDHHDEWSSIAEESLEFMNRLLATLGGGTETTKLTSEISSDCQAMVFRTLRCHRCEASLKSQAAKVLLYLSPNTPTSIVPGGSGSSSIFVWILLYIFLLPDFDFVVPCKQKGGPTHLLKKSTDIRRLAGQKMQAMVSSNTEASDMSMPPSVVAGVIGSLACRTVAGDENKGYRIHAATILEHLCRHYTTDDANLKELKKAVVNVMPKVLKEIVHWLAPEQIQAVPEANNGQESSTTHQQQQKGEQHQGMGIQLLEALQHLCETIQVQWIDPWNPHQYLYPYPYPPPPCSNPCHDQDMTRQLDEIAPKVQLDEIAAKVCSGPGMPEPDKKTFIELVSEARNKLKDEKKRASALAAVRT